MDDLSIFRLLKNSAEAVRLLNREGIKTIGVTNQSGIARGYYPESQVHNVNKKLEELLTAEGSHLDGLYYCPHHPSEGKGPFTFACECRKPEPGMLYRAETEHGVVLSRSFVVGDKLSDMELARRVGAKGVMVLSGYGRRELESSRSTGSPQPDYVSEDLLSAVKWIIDQMKAR